MIPLGALFYCRAQGDSNTQPDKGVRSPFALLYPFNKLSFLWYPLSPFLYLYDLKNIYYNYREGIS
jgi:hypothetical protein